ncbi:MAG TPA: hypothetical protein VFC16_17940 [Nakamurella sp.]|nr:hypothetical protein [Nakamurella sp.]
MTTHEEHASAAADAATGQATTPVTDLGDAAPAAASGVICQAEVVDIGLAGAGTDPFDATFLLAGTDPQGREIVVWIRLTPTTINDLIDRLGEVLFAQQDILGINRHQSTADDVDTDRAAADEDEPDPGEGRAKRFFDPMGIRNLRDRSPRTTVMLGVAIASLMLLAFVLQQIRG